MKKLLLLMCVLTTSLLHAMEQQQCWLTKLPSHVQAKIMGYLDNEEWQRGWLFHHMKTHQQGRYENPITMWDAKKCKTVFFVDLDLNMKRGLLGINRTLLNLESNRRKNLCSIKNKECFAAHLTDTWWRVVFLEWMGRSHDSHHLHVIDLHPTRKGVTKKAVHSFPITVGFDTTCIAVSRTKDIAILSNERFVVLDTDLTIKLDEDLKDMPFQNSMYYHAMDFSPDGSMIGIRSSEAVEFERNGRTLMNEGQKIIRVFDIPAQVLDTTLLEYCARSCICKDLSKQQSLQQETT